MENFFYNDEFYSEVGDLLHALDIDDECSSLPDDWVITCFESSLEPIAKINADWILERIDEERFSGEGREYDRIYELLVKMDFTELNEKMPQLYYPTRKSFTITKKDILNY